MNGHVSPEQHDIEAGWLFSRKRTNKRQLLGETRVRPIEPKDRLRIQRLHEEWFPVTYHEDFYNDLVHNRMAHTKEPLYTRAITRVADPEDAVIACVVAMLVDATRINDHTRNTLISNSQKWNQAFYIMTLGTVPEYRHAGLGSSLISTCIEEVQKNPRCGVLYLHVITVNEAAIRFYENLGFWKVTRIPDYYTIKGEKFDCFLYARYFHGNTGHLDLVTYLTGCLSSAWKRIKLHLPILSWSR